MPFRRLTGAASAGFWVRRTLFDKVGGFTDSLIVDEDTDLCCRLIAARHLPWFEPVTAIILDRDDTVSRLTNATDKTRRAQSYLTTYLNNRERLKPNREAISFLAFRALRMIDRSGDKALYATLMNAVDSLTLRTMLRAKHTFKTYR